MVLPEDVQAVAPAVIGHRLQPGAAAEDRPDTDLSRRLIESVAIP